MATSLKKTTSWTALSTLTKILIGLLVLKLMAMSFGKEGLGQAANYMTLLTILGTFAGAGIFNGVTKYVAEYEEQPSQLSALLKTSTSIIFIFSLLLGAIMFIFARPIAQFIFQRDDFVRIIQWVAVLQVCIAFGNYFIAILKGVKQAKLNALSIIWGSLFGVLGFVLLNYLGGYQSALIGLALIPGFIVLPASIYLFHYFKQYKSNLLNKIDLRLYFDSAMVKKLSVFFLMVLVTALTVPLAYMLMRNWLTINTSLSEVGLWVGVSKISDTYLQFIVAAFSVYLLPTFSQLKHFDAIKQELHKALGFVAVMGISLGSIIFLSRNIVINMVFSAEFMTMRDLFAFQLVGDVFRVLSYVFGYLIIAKAALKLYILAELLQTTLLLLGAKILIPKYGALGAVQSYTITYIVYFIICMIGFYLIVKRSKQEI